MGACSLENVLVRYDYRKEKSFSKLRYDCLGFFRSNPLVLAFDSLL